MVFLTISLPCTLPRWADGPASLQGRASSSFYPVQTPGDRQLGASGRGQTRTLAAAEQRCPGSPNELCATPRLPLRLDVVQCTHGPGTRWAQDQVRSLSSKVLQRPGLIPSSSGAGAAPSAVQRPSGAWPYSPPRPHGLGTSLSFCPGDPHSCDEPVTSGLHRSQCPADRGTDSTSFQPRKCHLLGTFGPSEALYHLPLLPLTTAAVTLPGCPTPPYCCRMPWPCLAFARPGF